MVTAMVHAKIKEDMLNEYIDLVKMLVRETTRKGCITYSFNQNKEIPTEFVLYEQWESKEALDNHIEELFKILGPAKPGYPVPEKLIKMYEYAKPVFYNVVE